MDTPTDLLIRTLALGLGATALMDLWLLVLKALDVPTLNFALLGRWVGHMPLGRFAHTRIANAPAIPAEHALGWAVHCATGVLWATVLVAIAGPAWLQTPTLAPALAVGMATVAVPLLVMQPAMGAGIASTRTPTPLHNCAKSVVNHTVFGLGLYATALVLSLFIQP